MCVFYYRLRYQDVLLLLLLLLLLLFCVFMCSAIYFGSEEVLKYLRKEKNLFLNVRYIAHKRRRKT